MKGEGNASAVGMAVAAVASSLASQYEAVSNECCCQLPGRNGPQPGVVHGHTLTATAVWLDIWMLSGNASPSSSISSTIICITS